MPAFGLRFGLVELQADVPALSRYQSGCQYRGLVPDRTDGDGTLPTGVTSPLTWTSIPSRSGKYDPVSLPSGLQPGRLQLLFGPIGIVALDGVAVVVQAGPLALEQRQEEAVSAAEEAVVLAAVPDDLQPQVLDVEVSGPGHAA